MLLLQIGSLVVYYVSLFVQLDTFSLDYILSKEFYKVAAVVFLMSGGLLWLIFIIFRLVKPDEVVKLKFMQEKSKCCGIKTLVHGKSSTGYNYFNFKTSKTVAQGEVLM